MTTPAHHVAQARPVLRSAAVTHDGTTTNTDRVRARLIARIRRRYRTLTERVVVGGPVELDFTRIEDPNRVLDEVAAAEDLRERLGAAAITQDAAGRPEPLHLPYWAELWDSAMGVGRFLIAEAAKERGVLWPGCAALDLGCGMGLSGTVAAALGARVMFADLEAPALLFAAWNSAPFRDRVRTRQLDWRSDDLGERFDLIVGADILYERSQWEYLNPFWRSHLAPGGAVVLGEPGRQTGDRFIPWIREHGWSLTLVEVPVETRSRPIRVLVLRLPPGG